MADAALEAAYGVLDWLAVEAALPFRTITARRRYLDLERKAFVPEHQDLHHRDETIWGPGDLPVAARFGWEGGVGALAARLGATLPLGKTEPNPYELARLGIQHQHMFFGTGTFDPVVGFEGSLALGPATLAAWASARLPLYSNGHGFRAGARVAAGAGVRGSLGLDRWSFLLQPEVYHEEPDRWASGELSRNSGRTDLIAAAGATYAFSAELAAHAIVKVPFWTHAVGGQLSIPAVVLVGLTATLRPFAGPTQ